MKPVDTKQTIAKAPESKKTAISRPSEPDVSVEHEKTPVVAEEVAASDGKVPLHIVSEEPVEKQVDSVEDVVKKEAIVVDKSIKKEPPVAKPVPVVEEHYPYTVHVSSYMNLQKTIVAVSSIKKKGFEPFTGLVSIPGKGNWYRIYIGYNRTYKEAVNAAAKVKQKLREDASAAKAIWAIQVGNTDTEAELTGLVNNLGEKGYYFCKIPVAKDSDVIRLLAGAYKTEQETVSMVNALKKDGFEPFVVKR